MRRAALPLLVLAGLLLGGLGALPASAEPSPSGPSGTPLVQPPTRQQIQDARVALARLNSGGHASAPRSVQVDPPRAAPAPSRSGGLGESGWWTVSAGALLLLVLSELTRLQLVRSRHRRRSGQRTSPSR